MWQPGGQSLIMTGHFLGSQGPMDVPGRERQSCLCATMRNCFVGTEPGVNTFVHVGHF